MEHLWQSGEGDLKRWVFALRNKWMTPFEIWIFEICNYCRVKRVLNFDLKEAFLGTYGSPPGYALDDISKHPLKCPKNLKISFLFKILISNWKLSFPKTSNFSAWKIFENLFLFNFLLEFEGATHKILFEYSQNATQKFSYGFSHESWHKK